MGGIGIAGLGLRAKGRGWLLYKSACITSLFAQAGRRVCYYGYHGKAQWEGMPNGQCEYRPPHPRLQGAVADVAQQRRRVVETPFVRASQVAVLGLVGEQLKGIQTVEQRRCRARRHEPSGTGA